MKIGDKVRFIGASGEQTRWGTHTNPDGILVIGEEYTVSNIEEHSWHTKVFLVGINGNFNSVCFEVVV
ncbi:MAG: hypothetical protein KKB59_19920 [Spirochaetes bacterium]|nr:hypothetical protein [Spirochaetota bacterium]